MFWKTRMIADLLFWIQLIGAFVLAGSQFFRLLETTEGQLLSVFFVVVVFMALHLLLAIGAHRAQPSRITRQTIWMFALWIMLLGSNIAAVFINGTYEWSPNDTRTVLIVLCSTGVVFALARFRGVGFSDPMPKGCLAIVFKSFPQFVVAVEIALKGGAGIPGLALIAGHVNIFTRLGQIWLLMREAGWDRNRVWLLASEVVNEISWTAVTVAWVIWFLT